MNVPHTCPIRFKLPLDTPQSKFPFISPNRCEERHEQNNATEQKIPTGKRTTNLD